MSLPAASASLRQYRWLVAPVLAWTFAAAVATLFLHLGSEIAEGETRVFDEYVLRLARGLRVNHAWLESVMRDLSGLGSSVALLVLIVGASGYLALIRSRVAAFGRALPSRQCGVGDGVVQDRLWTIAARSRVCCFFGLRYELPKRTFEYVGRGVPDACGIVGTYTQAHGRAHLYLVRGHVSHRLGGA